VPLPRLSQPGRLVELDAIAMAGPRDHLPAEPWFWGTLPFSQALACGDAIFVGGEAAFDADRNVMEPRDMVAQNHIAMDRIVEMVQHFGAETNEIMKVGCWHSGAAGVETLKRNVMVRSSHFNKPGPTSTGVPVDALIHPDFEVQIDAVAMTNRA